MTSAGADLVVGTAGHVDHGKTSLVRLLTGVDLDTLPEERERGITIALGFVDLTLPDGRRAALVDVPGHERLVRTMVAGATGIDAVVLCVSAVEGVMPQTREHLAILELLGIRDGLVAITMADLVDAELLELAVADVAELVAGTFLEGSPIVAVSAVDGRGREAILGSLARLPAVARSVEGPFRLPVDRAFVRTGFGTIVTGTVASGRVADGGQVALLPAGRTARIRGIQVHAAAAGEARAGWRAALNLAGVDVDEVPRGTVVASGAVPVTSVLDVRYHHLPTAEPLDDGAPVRVLLGTAERVGRLHLAEPGETVLPGASVFVQLRLDRPVPCLPGDRLVVRRTSPLETLGGGIVVDPWAPRIRPRDRARAGAELRRLEAGQRVVLLERAGEAGLTTETWEARGGGDDGAVVLGDRVFASTVVDRLQRALVEALTEHHATHPLSPGANRRELRRGRLAHLGERVFDALVERLAGTGDVLLDGALLRARTFDVRLDPTQERLRSRLREEVERAGLAGTDATRLRAAVDSSELDALVHLLESAGEIVRVPKLGLVSSTVLEGLRHGVVAWLDRHGELSPADFKELTGLSRKAAIPLLEWLDARRITRRRGDARVRAEGA